ncbi:DUF1622 domain-containing protein [Pseudosulfitobacter koreensis]|uniref:DUF1622 domain-containing protein n=1 Tax=Pseudosulfitobacter koreensis TaxID=2968472 RepID=A0ABT1Z481_9RHOB|nr:DUF1622 domain-containing protein [Pseudosulfitobacter koreense]MCR8827918.1 DUF1622 domain-containing protein [Pseudosulfitobacter koreense]
MRTARQKHPLNPLGLLIVAMSFCWAQTAAAQERTPAPNAQTGHTADWVDSALHWTVRAIEFVGIGAIVVGAVASVWIYLARISREGPGRENYHNLRSSLGRSILLGLEFLVAADIINTVAIDPTLESVAVLAAVVAVRTFLSFALETEITGRLPWKSGGD